MELFTLTALRNSNDTGLSIFDFIVENLSKLRFKHDGKYKENEIYEKYATIIDWLFRDAEPAKILQRVRNKYPVDYFQRIINEHISEKVKDQDLLRAANKWNHGKKEALIQIIIHTDHSENYLYNHLFEGIVLDENSIEYLIDEFIAGILGYEYPYEQTIALCLLLKLAKISGQNTKDLLFHKILEGLQKNVRERPIFYRLAYELFMESADETFWRQNYDCHFPSFSYVLTHIDQKAMMVELIRDVEPVIKFWTTETRTLMSEINAVQKAAIGWLKTHEGNP